MYKNVRFVLKTKNPNEKEAITNEHVLSMRPSYYDIDFVSQMKWTNFGLFHCFNMRTLNIKHTD